MALTEPSFATHQIHNLNNVTILSTSGSATVSGTIQFPEPGWHSFSCNFTDTSLALVWIDGHQVCSDYNMFSNNSLDLRAQVDGPVHIFDTKLQLPFRAHLYNNRSQVSTASPRFSMKWGLNTNKATVTIPDDVFSATMSDADVKRDQLQRSSLKGWASWVDNSILDIVKMPESIVLTLELCTKNPPNCVSELKIESDLVRVGGYAGDLSFAEVSIGNRTLGFNVTIAHGNIIKYDYWSLLLSTNTCEGGCGNYFVRIAPRSAWFRPASITTSNTTNTITMNATGFDPVTVFVKGGRASTAIGHHYLEVPLSLESNISISTRDEDSPATVLGQLSKAKEAHDQELLSRFRDLAPAAEAIEAAAMWNLMYIPTENGPMLPVSRSWNDVRGAVSTDFQYTVFEWDNFFASLLAGPFSKNFSYSNLIQIVKAKSAAGFIPNIESTGKKSQDRTEPPVGAKVVFELYSRFKDKWLVELLYHDLLDQNNWFLSNRMSQPHLGISLGSWDELGPMQDPPVIGKGNNMQAARYESGLDNSPMYDGEFFNNKTHFMELTDVGFTSLVANEAKYLAKLAEIIDRPQEEVSMLNNRVSRLVEVLNTKLYSSNDGIYENRFFNGTFYKRISPTSFYPLLVEAANNSVATEMMQKWLLNPNHFCISPTGDMSGNSDTCYWGLPSIAASDPAFPALGYWRGYIWGPLSQITHWALSEYNIPVVNNARRALCQQLTSMMMDQWNRNRHICENYGPHKNTTDCTGTKFYHWGALNGLISLVEEGLW
eukprot:TRINITY_DN28366_c0_g1_i1.p1 TRINITY_DN28366_c0_g1~~TRINITY_DN28366_c0_g1_i1.p1  ORF type:complete len:807 (+),score=98.63 TRINITY_DN28366_c0_g1_i1:110-2422(+)